MDGGRLDPGIRFRPGVYRSVICIYSSSADKSPGDLLRFRGHGCAVAEPE